MDKRGRNMEGNVTLVRKRLNPVGWNNSGIAPESTQDGGQRNLLVTKA